MSDRLDPVAPVCSMIDSSMELMRTWVNWDGQPIYADDRVYTPHKAMRRLTDHLIDHLAQVETKLAGGDPIPDNWHASAITTPSDFAAFSQEDVDEATARLTRLKTIWRSRLRGLSDAELDRSHADDWSIREIATHLVESGYYAEAVGRLS